MIDSIPASNKSPLEYMGDRLPHSFFCLPATSDEVQKLLSSFVCKGCNLKSIPMFIYKYLFSVISPIISNFLNISIEEGVFPDCLKTGRVQYSPFIRGYIDIGAIFNIPFISLGMPL